MTGLIASRVEFGSFALRVMGAVIIFHAAKASPPQASGKQDNWQPWGAHGWPSFLRGMDAQPTRFELLLSVSMPSIPRSLEEVPPPRQERRQVLPNKAQTGLSRSPPLIQTV